MSIEEEVFYCNRFEDRYLPVTRAVTSAVIIATKTGLILELEQEVAFTLCSSTLNLELVGELHDMLLLCILP